MLPYGFQEQSVAKAIKIAGGVTFVSNLLAVSNGAVHSWVKKRRVTIIQYAKKLAELSGIPLEKIKPC